MERETEREEKPYNYLEEYLTDSYADVTGEQPIVFDWSRINELDLIERDEKWDTSPQAKRSLKLGFPVQRVFVRCPNPKHDCFYQVMQDPDTDRDHKCYHCVTEEIDRIINLRAARDRERMRRMARQ